MASVISQEQATTIGQRYLSGETVGIRDLQAVARHYPEYMRQLERAKYAGTRAEAVGQAYLAGERVGIKEVAAVARYYPEYMKQLQQARYPSEPQDPQTILRREKMLGRMEEQRERTRYYETVATPEESELKRSMSFYPAIGYPEYAGKYGAFTIPKGHKIEAITKTPTGLTVTFKAPEETKGIAETILGWDVPVYKGPSVMDILSPGTKKLPLTATASEFSRIAGITVHPLAPIAGPIASVESPVYSLAHLVGIPSPRPPPTFIGGVIGKGFQAGLGWESTELERTMKYGPQYAVGTVLGDVLLSMAIGKVWQKTVGKVIAKKTQSWLTTKYIEKGPLAWKGWKEKTVMRLTGVKPYLARGEIGLPSLVQPLSLQQLQAAQVSWQLTQAPRVGGVWLRNIGLAPTKTTVLPHLISRAGKISIGYLRELSYVEEPIWKRGLLPFVTQKQVTRMGIVPYIPKAIAVTGKKGVSQLVLGLAVTTMWKLKPPTEVRERVIPPLSLVPTERLQRKQRQVVTPKVWWPTLAYQREKLKALTIETPKTKERLIPVLKIPTPSAQITRRESTLVSLQIPKQSPYTPQIITQISTTVTVQKTTQIPSFPTPTLTIPTTPTPRFSPFRLPHGGRDVSRRKRGLFGAWFKRTHRIKTHVEMWRTFKLTPKKPKKRKGKKRKKRKKRRKKR